MVNVACIYALRPPENGRAANIHIHKTCILAAHNPEAAGSSPVSATTPRPVFVGKQDGFFAYMEKTTRLSNIIRVEKCHDAMTTFENYLKQHNSQTNDML